MMKKRLLNVNSRFNLLRIFTYSSSNAAKYLSASKAAILPVPAAVTAC
jgi:hypothetical protein